MHQITLLDKTSKAQVNQFLDLLLSSFKGDLEYFKWKHNIDETYHIEEYTFCVFENDICIATTQVIVHDMIVSGKTHRFGLLCDGATHKDYRRLGLFEKLLSHINTFCVQKHVDFVYSTGNEKSRKALIKLGFQDFFTSLRASKRLRFNHPILNMYNLALNIFGNISSPKFDNIKPLSIADYSNFSADSRANIKISFDKNVDYLTWRLDETSGTYDVYGSFDSTDKVTGVMVLKTLDNRIYIVDLLASNPEDIDSLLKFATAVALKNKAIQKINTSHNNFKVYKSHLVSNKYKLFDDSSVTLIYILNSDFKLANLDLENMHYMRIDKNE
ncbi:GNAT family N-acetyltransferase [uncultured Psychroserpens sp.]|uniref:GNAT family N-acetyltransferase n=1 Tax=uncultured Psychroserpens sp. TaxID=255436 RepID=UPI0026277EEF|nr:GNAT family N-acetyltransferase [uncultured Psychroserpens sp.]